jgi:hypothetical protein
LAGKRRSADIAGPDGGYVMFDQEVRFVDSGRPLGVTTDVGGRGWFGTVKVGCDYQISSNLVIGAFADYDFSGIKGIDLKCGKRPGPIGVLAYFVTQMFGFARPISFSVEHGASRHE